MKQRSWFKVSGIYLGTSIFLIFLLFLPKLLSTGSGKYLLFSLIHKESGLSCSAQELHISWFGPQTAKKIKLIGEADNEVFSAEKLQLDGSLLRLLIYKKPIGITLSGWSLKINEPASIDHPSVSHLDPGSLLSYLNTSKILCEHGSINMKTVSGSWLSVSGFYLERSTKKFMTKCVVSEDQQSGTIFIESIFSPTSISAQFSSVPIAFFKIFIASPFWDHLLSYEDIVNLSAEAAHTNDGKISMTASCQGNQIQCKLQGHVYKSVFYIIEGSSSFIELKPELASALCNLMIPLSTPISSKQIHATVSHAKIPLDISKWKQIEITSQAQLPQISIYPEDPNLALQLRDTQLGIKKTEKFSDIRYASSTVLGGAAPSHLNGLIRIDSKKKLTKFRLQQAQLPHTYLRAIFPKPFIINTPLDVPYYSLNIEGTYKNAHLDADVILDNPLLKLTCSASGAWKNFLFKGEGTYHFNKKWQKILSPHFSSAEATFSGRAQITEMNLFFPKFSGKITAGENEFFIHAKFGSPREPIKPETTSILVHGHFSSLPLSLISNHFSPFQLKDLNFSFHTDGAKFITKGNLQALIDNPDYPNLNHTRILVPEILITPEEFSSPSLEDLTVQCSGEIFSLPLDSITKIYGKKVLLSPYFGSSGDIKFELNYNPKDLEQLKLNSNFKSDALLAELNLIMDSSMKLSSGSQGILQWEVTPERYASFFKNASCLPTCLLHRTASLRLDVSKLSCPDQTKGLSCLTLLVAGGLEGSLATTPLIFYDNVSKETFIINDFQGSLQADNLDSKIEYKLNGSCLAPRQDSKAPAEFSLEGRVNHLFSPESRQFKQTAHWIHIPSSFIAGIMPMSLGLKAQICSLAGPRINVSIKNELDIGEGSIDIMVDSENLQAQIPLILKEQSILLRDNLKAHLNINEDVNKAFLQEFNPLMAGGAYSQHPVTLEINKQNFYLPIRPYSFEEFRIQSATLDIGKVSIANTGTMYALFRFLDITENKQFVESWFTPIFFSVQKGSINCKRFDALIDGRIRLALWGKTDIANDRLFMTLGIDPEVIKKYFHNTSLKTKDFFLIKIRGSILSPEVDWSSAYARIALLKSYSLGNPFSSLADKLFSSLGDSTPPPTVHPFPWEKNNPNSIENKLSGK
ncbi:hypothetical protein C10C_0164 [Chlamydia serpentis]|uniref:Transmembrane protein n=1 Tax=Chlamydia serpentis TaxID=1967782 RepID=A0A2R8FAA4_9CHLA|nr:hypothetical protein [Chlamydia serpentis]SPN73345.1 hypothetical protein C10C_0164 [Chlamydia serpentis]